MNRTVFLVVLAVCLRGTAFGEGPPGEEVVFAGKSLVDVSAAPGAHIKKSGEGVAVVALKDGAKYTVSMAGAGTLYLIGMDDYSSVEVISKTGDGDLVWVPPMNPHAARAGPTLKGKLDGNGRIRSGTQKEISELRTREGRAEARPGCS